MKKVLIAASFALFLCLVYASTSDAQQPIEGHWKGTMIREGSKLPVSFDFTKEEAGLKASFNSLTQRAVGIPIRNVSFMAPKIHLELVGDTTTIVFDGEVAGDSIVGQFRENEANGTFTLQRVVPQPPAFKQEEVFFKNGDTTLSGTLMLPLNEHLTRPSYFFMVPDLKRDMARVFSQSISPDTALQL